VHACRRDRDVESVRQGDSCPGIGATGTVVTLDADFHAILAVSGASGPSVIRVRRQGLNALAVVELVENVVADFGFDLACGSLVTVRVNKATCHKLPIGGL
jgi:hypothetical protein